ncbi:MAG: DUF1735 domain-containing protein [Sphingobacteriales bacterium]|nr:MAG: DUF1735 domain-containing protein [Sphingobacteriales bacterium]
MKHKSLVLALSAFAIIASVGCLKDKNFEDQVYAIQPQEVRGVSLVQSPTSPIVAGITGMPTPVTIAGPLIHIEAFGPATTDVTVNLAFDDQAVRDANADLAPADQMELLPAGSYSLNTMSPVIKKDSVSISNLVFTLLNTNGLDPNKQYGIGVRISSLSGGDYQIAENMRTVVFKINIKNKYDGIWLLSGVHNRSPYDLDPYHDKEIYLITSGPNSVYHYWPDVPGVGRPISGNNTWYGPTFSPVLTFNPANDFLSAVTNFNPPASPVFTVGPSTNSRFVADTTFKGVEHSKVIFAQYYYNNNLLRGFKDTLVYVGPR